MVSSFRAGSHGDFNHGLKHLRKESKQRKELICLSLMHP